MSTYTCSADHLELRVWLEYGDNLKWSEEAVNRTILDGWNHVIEDTKNIHKSRRTRCRYLFGCGYFIGFGKHFPSAGALWKSV